MFKYVKSILMALVVSVVMIGCGGSEPTPSSEAAGAVAGMKNVYVSSKATYNGSIAQNIKTECTIDSQVIHWLQAYAKKQNINIIIDGKPSAKDSVLKISITDAISQRVGMGHNKYVVISGKLYEGKKLKASFKAARRSGGGYFAAYRNSCSVLGSCAKTLGRDTASWLKNPTDGAKLGDVYLIH